MTQASVHQNLCAGYEKFPTCLMEVSLTAQPQQSLPLHAEIKAGRHTKK